MCDFVHKLVISIYVMIFLLTIFAMAFSLLTYKVIKIVQKTDIIMPTMLCTFTLAIFAYIVYNVFLIVRVHHFYWYYGDSQNYTCTYLYLTYSPLLLLTIGIVLNLNRWVSFMVYIYSETRDPKGNKHESHTMKAET